MLVDELYIRIKTTLRNGVIAVCRADDASMPDRCVGRGEDDIDDIEASRLKLDRETAVRRQQMSPGVIILLP